MSHYALLVIGEDVEGQLEPFDENMEVPEYKKDLVSVEDKNTFREVYSECDEKRSYGCKTKEEEIENSKLTFKELYEKFGSDWNDNIWRDDGDGNLSENLAEYSTYNPDSKWDWFSVGGRWDGLLKLKNGDEVNSAVIGDIDFSADEEEYKEAVRFWELYIEGQEPKDEKEKKIIDHTFYRKEYYEEMYRTKEVYAKSLSEFGTFAVLKDGEWFEKGDMGWFGCSSETGEEARDWDKGFFDKFLKDLDDDVKLTVVDCHI